MPINDASDPRKVLDAIPETAKTSDLAQDRVDDEAVLLPPALARLAVRLLHSVARTTDLHDFLGVVARGAPWAVPGCDSASITVIHDGAATTVATSDQRALTVDEIQYAGGDGPCLHAARFNLAVRLDDLTTGTSWPVWRRGATKSGITASISMPLPTDANIAAALNLYTTSASGWPDTAFDAARLVADSASDAITLAYRINGRFSDVHHISRRAVPRQTH